MSDLVTSDLLKSGAPAISLCSLPTEMLWTIFSDSNLVSLMGLSSTCSTLRYLVHEIFTSRIADQAKKYPEVKRSLDRIGWKKKHNFWNCNCFKMVAGPSFTWNELEEDKNFTAIPRETLVTTATIAAGKIFVAVKSGIRYSQIASETGPSGRNPLRSFASFNIPVGNVALASYDNVLAVSFTQYFPRWGSSVCIFNVGTLENVKEMDVFQNGNGVLISTPDIAVSQDTMLVCLKFISQIGAADRESTIQIWKLNTEDPQAEGIAFLYTVSRSNAPLSKHLQFRNCTKKLFCVNNKYLVMFDVVVKVFGRSADNPLVSCIGTDNKYPKAMALQSGQGDHLVVALRSLNADKITECVIVNVFSASRGELILQKIINPYPKLNGSFSMEWFGDHLIVGSYNGNTISFLTWQPDLPYFLNSPCPVPVVRRSPRRTCGETNTTWAASCLHLDFEGLTTSVYGRRDWRHWPQKTPACFKTWRSSS